MDSLPLKETKITAYIPCCQSLDLQFNVCVCVCVCVGWGVYPGAVSGGSWLGQEELMSGGGSAHAAGLPYSHHPLQAHGEPQEDRQE